MLRITRPKFTISVPTITSPTVSSMAPKSPFPFAAGAAAGQSAGLSTGALSPALLSPLPSPTARNTLINARKFVTIPSLPVSNLQVPSGKGCLRKAAPGALNVKKISFSESASVALVSPLPSACYGVYERR